MDTRTPKKQWTLAMRANHWLMVVTILVLTITGFYIADPFTVSSGETIDKFLMGWMRYFHLMAGFVLTFVFFWRIYLAFFSRFHADWKDFFAWTDFHNLLTQLKFYTFISRKKPEHIRLYGPLQSIAYSVLMFLLLVMVVTGLILSGAEYHAGVTSWAYAAVGPVENLLGGLAVTRFIHHAFTWLVILFAVVHVYMAFWYDVVFREGTVSSMIGGHVFRKEEQ